MLTGIALGLAAGIVLGIAVGLLARSGQVTRATTARARLEAELAATRASAGERATALEDVRRQMAGEFAQLSSQALRQNADQFLQLADTRLGESRQAAEGDLARRQEAIEHLLVPIAEQLGKYDEGMQALERERLRSYTALTEQMQQLSTSHDRLQKETRSLVTALRSPQTRGRWGELQLRRVVEMAGMLERCDFSEQVSSDGDAGRMRPDMVVHLPGGKNVAVDAKVPMQAFLDANEAEDESVRRMHLASHGRQMKAHVDALAKKEYWKRVDPSPEFVVAFVPGDPLLTAALEHEPGLMEYAVANHVLLATPTSLIALLRAVAYGWQQEALTENARQVQVLGAQLYERISVLGDHMAGVGKSLTGAVAAYNRAVGSLEGRVLVTARRFVEMGVVGQGELPQPAPVDSATRPLQASELVATTHSDDGMSVPTAGHAATNDGRGELRPT
ncbi:MAG: DNA recombination protein RmuC [Acidimicrobiales bacterium]|jgi:DNA recombination protein RmuC